MGGYDGWRSRVSALCWALYGLEVDSVPDLPLAGWHEDGLAPVTAARRTVRWAREAGYSVPRIVRELQRRGRRLAKI